MKIDKEKLTRLIGDSTFGSGTLAHAAQIHPDELQRLIGREEGDEELVAKIEGILGEPFQVDSPDIGDILGEPSPATIPETEGVPPPSDVPLTEEPEPELDEATAETLEDEVIIILESQDASAGGDVLNLQDHNVPEEEEYALAPDEALSANEKTVPRTNHTPKKIVTSNNLSEEATPQPLAITMALSVDKIKELVEDNSVSPEIILEAEKQTEFPRVTLTRWLEEILQDVRNET